MEISSERREDPGDKVQYEEFVCLISRSWRIGYFERLTSLLIPFNQEGISYTTDLKETYWWYGMKRDVAEYVALLRHMSESQN
jgi:hypothetical protein